MTELETAIRDALHSRADTFEPHETELRSRRPRRWLPPTIAAAVVMLLAVTAALLVTRHKAADQPPAAPKPASFVGYSWQLVQLDDRQGRLTLPASTKAEVTFGQRGTMTGDDSVHSLQVQYRLVTTGYQPAGQVMTSANGLGGAISTTLKRTLFAIGSCFSSSVPGGSKPPQSAPIAATVHGDRLTLHTSDGVLTFVRTGPA